MEIVEFVTVMGGRFAESEQEAKDLIVSFAIRGDAPGEVESLTLLRTPIYEPLQPPGDRGVSVGHERFEAEDLEKFGDEPEILERVELGKERCRIVTARREYALDLRAVDPEEVSRAREMLQAMNFDEGFRLELL